MKQKLLIIAPKLPDSPENRRDRRFISLIGALSGAYEVHFLFIQSLFVKEDAVKSMTEKGVKVISLHELKKLHRTSNIIRHFLEEGKYAVVLFNTYFTAKYYLPYLHAYSPESLVVIDIGKSQYISEINIANEQKDPHKKIGMLKNIEAGKMKEIAIYNHADAVVVDTAEDAEILSKDIPSGDVRVISFSGNGQGDAQDDMRAAPEVFATFSKRKSTAGDASVNAVVIGTASGAAEADEELLRRIGHVPLVRNSTLVTVSEGDESSLIKMYNEGLKKISGEFGLLFPADAVVPEASARRMYDCAQSHPHNGIVSPLSNAEANGSLTLKSLGDFLEKHYISDFGNWQDVKCVRGRCLLVRRRLVEAIGLLDEELRTLEYALFDYSLRAVQHGFHCIRNNEAFVYYAPVAAEDRARLAEDRRFFYKKWCNLGREFLDCLGQAS